MRTLNNIFAAVYSIVLIVSIWFGINWITTRGMSSMFDNLTEFIFAVLYVAALLLSIFIHINLRNKPSIANKICAVVTSINIILLAGLILTAFNSGSDAGLFLAAWMFIVLGFWLVSLISGIAALESGNNEVI